MTSENDRAIQRLELQLEEIQKELRKRKLEQQPKIEGSPVQFSPDASSVSLTRAQTEVEAMFRRWKPFDFQRALFLLRTHPVLVLEAFADQTVMSYFLQGRADLPIMRGLCDLYRQQLPWNPTLEEAQKNGLTNPFVPLAPPVSSWIYSFDREPNFIADACTYGAAPGVMKLLIEQFPHQLLRGDALEGKRWEIPLMLLLNRAAYRDHPCEPGQAELMDTLDTMLAFKPDLFLHCGYSIRNCVKSILNDAFASPDYISGCTPEMKKYLVEKFAQYKFKGDKDMFISSPIDMAEAQLMCPLLPKLQTFDLSPEEIDQEVLKYVVEQLCLCKPDLKRLTLPVRSTLISAGEWDFPPWKLVASCPSLKTLGLFDYEFTGGAIEAIKTVGDDMMEVCEKMVNANPRVEKLELENFCFHSPSQIFCLMSPQKEIKISYTTLLNEQPSIILSEAVCSIERLELDLTFSDLSEGGWMSFLNQVGGKLPRLQHLKIENSDSEVDATEPIASVLNENKLRTLDITDCQLDWKIISGVLVDNTSLMDLKFSAPFETNKLKDLADVLKSHNKTLTNAEFVSREPLGNIGQKINFYCLVNRCGRARLQDDTASLVDLVTSICQSLNHPDALMVHSAQYELLRMAPTVWSGVNFRKRRREDSR